jgi:hypothetical protein
MEPDLELKTWRRQWQTDAVIPPDLRQRVERETRDLRRQLYGSIAVTVIMGGGAAGWALVSQRPTVVVLAIGVWFFIAVAWVISIGLTRDILSPSADTTTAFVDLSIRRCRRRLHGLVAQALLYVAIAAFDLVWIYHYQVETRPTRPMDPLTFLTSGPMLVAWAALAVPVAVGVWYRGRLRNELQNLLLLRNQFDQSER